MSSLNFHVHNLGCKVNRVESDSISAALLSAGGRQSSLQEAAIVIINTCTVTGEADAKARKAVRHALACAPEAGVIVTGCAVAIDADRYLQIDKRVIVEPNKNEVPALACAILGISKDEPGTSLLPPAFSRVGEGFMSRAGIKIQDGCDNACTYCIVHVARGPLWSRPFHEVIEEVESAQAAGCHEVVLTGINIGKYHDGVDLVGLLEVLLEKAPLVRIRISSIEPMDVSDSLIHLLARSEGRICRHLHLPLQSGADKTLAEMNRLYAASGYAATVKRLKDAVEDIAITTDVIAGFPGETEADFEESLGFCQDMGFSKMHVFRYSKRPGTPAAERPDQVSQEIIALRAERLRKLGDVLRRKNASARIGREEQILIESSFGATSESYFDVRFTTPDRVFESHSAGSLVKGIIKNVENDTLICDVGR